MCVRMCVCPIHQKQVSGTRAPLYVSRKSLNPLRMIGLSSPTCPLSLCLWGVSSVAHAPFTARDFFHYFAVLFDVRSQQTEWGRPFQYHQSDCGHLLRPVCREGQNNVGVTTLACYAVSFGVLRLHQSIDVDPCQSLLPRLIFYDKHSNSKSRTEVASHRVLHLTSPTCVLNI